MSVSSAPATSTSASNVIRKVHMQPIKKKGDCKMTCAEKVVPIQPLFACEDFFLSLTELFTLVICFSAKQKL